MRAEGGERRRADSGDIERGLWGHGLDAGKAGMHIVASLVTDAITEWPGRSHRDHQRT